VRDASAIERTATRLRRAQTQLILATSKSAFGIVISAKRVFRQIAAARIYMEVTCKRIERRLVVSKILNHVERSITAVYDRHSYDREKQAALLKWDRWLAEIVSSQPAGNVIEFPTRA
jgi:hypothetical protein